MTPNVQNLCSRVYTALETPEKIAKPVITSRELCEAMLADMRENPGYEPEKDVRVLWLREIIALWVCIGKPPKYAAIYRSRRTSAHVAAVEMLLGKASLQPSGKERAAGGGQWDE